MTEFNPETGTAVDDPSDELVERIYCVLCEPLDPLVRNYLEAANARIQYLERKLV